jgi:hypothetical protein
MSILDINRPSTQDVANVIRRLCAAHLRPFKADMEAMIEEWHGSLAGRFSRDIIAAAADRSRDNDPDFPKLPRFRSHCFDLERERQPERSTQSPKQQYAAWFADLALAAGESLPCPICGTCIEITSRGYLSVHDDAQHTRARVSFTNLGQVEWRHMGPLEELPPKKRAPLHPSNPAAAAIAPIAEVVKAQIQKAAAKHVEHAIWQDVPLPEAPPDAVLSHR